MRKIIIFAISLWALGASFVSCQKETLSTSQKMSNSSQPHYQPPQVDDMNAYLRAFKQKMQTRGNDDAMELEDAAWHLSSVANHDLGNVTSNYAKIHYDTLYYHIIVSNGMVNLSDLSMLYSRVSADIEALFQSLDFENKHIRFIGANIADDGNVTIPVMVTRDWVDHQWFFNDPFELVEILDQYYSDDSTYYMAGNFRTELKRVLDIITGYSYSGNGGSHYLVYSRTDSLRYRYYPDPYSCVNYHCSRIFADMGHSATMSMDEMYYYTDSYAGISVSNAGTNDHVISWYISELRHDPVNHYQNTYHVPAIKYGCLFQSDTIVPPVN